MNPENNIDIDDTNERNEILESLIKEVADIINWDKAFPLTRYTSEAPPIIIDNIEEVSDLNEESSIQNRFISSNLPLRLPFWQMARIKKSQPPFYLSKNGKNRPREKQ